MGVEEEVMNRHLQVCKEICDGPGYSTLSSSSQREEVKKRVLEFFTGNGHDLGKILQMLNKFDIAIFRFLETYVMNRGSRPLGWGDYHEDSLRAEMLYELMYNPH